VAKVGEILKKVREAKGISLESIAAEIKIPIYYLRAIETGDWEKLPASAYVKGYLRLYANYLGLSPERIIAQYEKETEPIVISVETKPKKKFNYITLIIILFFLGLITLILTMISETSHEPSISTISRELPKITPPSPPPKTETKIEKTPSFYVKRIYICEGIKNREPINPAEVFKLKKTTHLYCFTEIVGARKPIEIRHVWFYKGKAVMGINLPVKGKRWRTWSKKIIYPDLKGQWEVIIFGPKKERLASIKFRIE